jgi:hypothetical protein
LLYTDGMYITTGREAKGMLLPNATDQLVYDQNNCPSCK